MKNKGVSVFYTLPQILLDIVCIYANYQIAFILRLDNKAPSNYVDIFQCFMPWVTIICLTIFALSRPHNTMWQFASLDKLIQIRSGTGFASALLLVLGYAVFDLEHFPFIVYVMGGIPMLLFVGFSRFSFRPMRRVRKKNELPRRRDKEEFRRMMIIGAGKTGSMIIKEMRSAPETSEIPVVATDDNRAKRGSRIHGAKVVGGRESITRAAVCYNVDQILLVIPTSKKKDLQETLQICSKTGCQLKTASEYSEVLENSVDTQSIRDVEITDPLGRDETTLDANETYGYLKDKTVLVTGGGGSVGSELRRQIALFNSKKIIIFDIYENNAYDLQNELLTRFKRPDLEVLTGSMRDVSRINHVFEACRPDVAFHAAAHKHVPSMELSPGEAVKSNVFGTLNVAKAADKYGVKHMVLISINKAMNPTNAIGATKCICELIIQYFSCRNKTDFVAVRLGNVLDSNGSVILLFKKQIASGGPVMVTHPDIIHYFMTIPEAVRLVLQAGGMARGGKIFVPDMSQSIKIADLACNLIRPSGYEPDIDIKIVYTGLRPSKKLYEEPLFDSEGGCAKTSHELIYIGTPIPFNEEIFLSELDTLRRCAGVNDVRMMEIIHHLVPTYNGRVEKSDALTQAEEEEETEE